MGLKLDVWVACFEAVDTSPILEQENLDTLVSMPKRPSGRAVIASQRIVQPKFDTEKRV
jgi:hypothetical protein